MPFLGFFVLHLLGSNIRSSSPRETLHVQNLLPLLPAALFPPSHDNVPSLFLTPTPKSKN